MTLPNRWILYTIVEPLPMPSFMPFCKPNKQTKPNVMNIINYGFLCFYFDVFVDGRVGGTHFRYVLRFAGCCPAVFLSHRKTHGGHFETDAADCCCCWRLSGDERFEERGQRRHTTAIETGPRGRRSRGNRPEYGPTELETDGVQIEYE